MYKKSPVGALALSYR